MRQSLVPVEQVEVVPGALSATLYLDRVNGGVEHEVWLFASRGMEAVGAPEVVFAVRRDGPPPTRVLDLFRSLHDQAVRGAAVSPGDALEVVQGTFGFGPAISGFLCLPYRLHDRGCPRSTASGARRCSWSRCWPASTGPRSGTATCGCWRSWAS